MVYRGKIMNGVVVLSGNPPLSEGTEVEVSPVTEQMQPRRGSAEAIMRHAGTWQGEAGEMDRLLAELKEMKRAEVEAQLLEDSDDSLSP